MGKASPWSLWPQGESHTGCNGGRLPRQRQGTGVPHQGLTETHQPEQAPMAEQDTASTTQAKNGQETTKFLDLLEGW